MPGQLKIHMLGELRLVRDGTSLDLPPSRKTRALLAYLLLTGRPHRRERLTELFWDLPDDPRGSLRWALSKIRQVVDEEDLLRVEADRERVSVSRKALSIDYVDIVHRLQSMDTVSLAELQSMARTLALPLLDGLDVPQLDSYQAWLAAEREEALQLRLEVLRRITLHPETSDQDAVRWLRHWQSSPPGYSPVP